jgi:hypothetical protein
MATKTKTTAVPFSVEDEITTALGTTSALSEKTFAGFVTFTAGDTFTIARIAFVVSSRGVGKSDGKTSVTRLATESGRTRSLLSQYATQIGWLDTTGTPITADAFAIVKTLYNRGAAARKIVNGKISEITDLPTVTAKVKAWRALSTATKSTASDSPATEPTATPDTRAARPADGSPAGEPFTAGSWLDALDSLRSTVAVLDGAPEETLSLARDILAEISARVGATVDA